MLAGFTSEVRLTVATPFVTPAPVALPSNRTASLARKLVKPFGVVSVFSFQAEELGSSDQSVVVPRQIGQAAVMSSSIFLALLSSVTPWRAPAVPE